MMPQAQNPNPTPQEIPNVPTPGPEIEPVPPRQPEIPTPPPDTITPDSPSGPEIDPTPVPNEVPIPDAPGDMPPPPQTV